MMDEMLLRCVSTANRRRASFSKNLREDKGRDFHNNVLADATPLRCDERLDE